MTFDDYVIAVDRVRASYSNWRLGQTAFNMLLCSRPRLADSLRGNPSLDPFHRDENLPEFYGYVRDNWDRFDIPEEGR